MRGAAHIHAIATLCMTALLPCLAFSGCGQAPSPDPQLSSPQPAEQRDPQEAAPPKAALPTAAEAGDGATVRPVFDNVAHESGVDFTYDRDVVEGRLKNVKHLVGQKLFTRCASKYSSHESGKDRQTPDQSG